MLSVSVAIPVFNEEKYLPTCLQAIRNQNYDKSYELLVIDNCSTDKSAKIAKEYGARVVKEPKKGMLFAKHRCFMEARGDIVATTDADSIVPIDWLRQIVKPFQQDHQVVAVTGIDHFPQPEHRLFYYFSQLNMIFQKWYYCLLHHPFTLRGPNRAVKKEAYIRCGGININGTTIEDEYFLSKKLKKYGKIVLLSDLVTNSSFRRLQNQSFLKYIKYFLWQYFFLGFLHHFLKKKINYSIKDVR